MPYINQLHVESIGPPCNYASIGCCNSWSNVYKYKYKTSLRASSIIVISKVDTLRVATVGYPIESIHLTQRSRDHLCYETSLQNLAPLTLLLPRILSLPVFISFPFSSRVFVFIFGPLLLTQDTPTLTESCGELKKCR